MYVLREMHMCTDVHDVHVCVCSVYTTQGKFIVLRAVV